MSVLSKALGAVGMLVLLAISFRPVDHYGQSDHIVLGHLTDGGGRPLAAGTEVITVQEQFQFDDDAWLKIERHKHRVDLGYARSAGESARAELDENGRFRAERRPVFSFGSWAWQRWLGVRPEIPEPEPCLGLAVTIAGRTTVWIRLDERRLRVTKVVGETKSFNQELESISIPLRKDPPK